MDTRKRQALCNLADQTTAAAKAGKLSGSRTLAKDAMRNLARSLDAIGETARRDAALEAAASL